MLDIPFPSITFQYSLLFRGLTNTNTNVVKQALPITPELLREIFSVLDFSNHELVSTWSSFLIAFFTLSRKSNLVPFSAKTFDKDKHLCWDDICITHDYLIVSFKWSKTNQARNHTLKVPICRIPGSRLCPVKAFKLHHKLNFNTLSSSAFSFLHKGKVKHLTHSLFVNNLRKLLSLVGTDPSGFSGHSFRRGGATWAFSCGVPGELIKLQGGWVSDCYLRYLDYSLESKLSVSKAMASHLP